MIRREENLTTYGSTLVNAANKYKDVYSKGSSDDRTLNYAMSTPDRGHYGDAMWETSNSGNDQYSWYSDYAYFPYHNIPFFHRGGYYYNTSYAGVFNFDCYHGKYDSGYGFRVVVPVL